MPCFIVGSSSPAIPNSVQAPAPILTGNSLATAAGTSTVPTGSPLSSPVQGTELSNTAAATGEVTQEVKPNTEASGAS